MGSIDGVGHSVTFFNVKATDSLTVAYGSENTGKIGLYVNNIRKDFNFISTGSYNNFTTATINVTVPAGASVMIKYDNGDKALNLDYIEYSPKN